MVITKARTLNGGSRSFLLKASASTFAIIITEQLQPSALSHVQFLLNENV
nr:hypothetical protein [Tanacetum cinerariifolium]